MYHNQGYSIIYVNTAVVPEQVSNTSTSTNETTHLTEEETTKSDSRSDYAYSSVPVPVSNENSVITGQPAPGEFGEPLNHVSGLKHLAPLDRLRMTRKKFLEGAEIINKLSIQDPLGRELFTANYGIISRPFNITFKDKSNRDVVYFSVPPVRIVLKCICLWPSISQKVDVFASPADKVGTVELDYGVFLTPRFVAKDSQGNIMFKIRGPSYLDSLKGSTEFQIISRDGLSQVGMISRQFPISPNEAFPNSENFGVDFTVELDVRSKAILLGACFFLNLLFFEETRNQNQQHYA